MSHLLNTFGQPIGVPVPNWTKRPLPPRTPMIGSYCSVEPLDPSRHGDQLFEANALDEGGRNWTYLFADPPSNRDAYKTWLTAKASENDPLFHAIVDSERDMAVGVASFMRIDADNGVMEVGHLNFSPALQRTPAATEAMYLMMRRTFDELGYRRYEWKCDSLNAPSQAAARRLGFRYEGLFRQAVVYKGRNRDTAWFSILDSEWPALKNAFERWLDPANFDSQGGQRESLGAMMAKA